MVSYFKIHNFITGYTIYQLFESTLNFVHVQCVTRERDVHFTSNLGITNCVCSVRKLVRNERLAGYRSGRVDPADFQKPIGQKTLNDV